jgi:hypothetical protein
MALDTMIRVQPAAVILLAVVSACSGDHSVDCRTLAPADCEKHPECYSTAASRLSEECTFQVTPAACEREEMPQCEQIGFFIRDPSGTCWQPDVCSVPPGWIPDDAGVCAAAQKATWAACSAGDGGVDGPAGVPEAGSP